MLRGLYTAATGMRAQELNIDVIANNLSNVNTSGYKKSRADFEDLVYQYIVDPGAPTSDSTSTPSGISVGLGVKPSAVQKQFTQGDLTATGNQLDVAIEGDGFFIVTLPDGEAYTRSGTFQLNNNGSIVTPEGHAIAGFTVPADATSITITRDGTVSAVIPGSPTPANLGQIQGARFANPAGLRAVGQNMFRETQASGPALPGTFDQNGLGRLNQGFLESSNVSIVSEVVNMITGQRAYEASSKGVQTADEMLSQAINLRR
jgi:flagellar basal-body rod protein FlgG